VAGSAKKGGVILKERPLIEKKEPGPETNREDHEVFVTGKKEKGGSGTAQKEVCDPKKNQI